MENTKVVIVEGNIGSGKTTLTRNLQQMFGGTLYLEPVDDNPYLADFYDDPYRYAFSMQVFLLSRRFQLQQAASWSEGIGWLDRSLYGDAVFARQLWKSSCISDLDFQTYMTLSQRMQRFLPRPDLILFLDVPATICEQRIKEFRKRECEKEIPLSYLEDLEETYHQEIAHLDKEFSCVVRIDGSEAEASVLKRAAFLIKNA